jgi:hypothetical protein
MVAAQRCIPNSWEWDPMKTGHLPLLGMASGTIFKAILYTLPRLRLRCGALRAFLWGRDEVLALLRSRPRDVRYALFLRKEIPRPRAAPTTPHFNIFGSSLCKPLY